MPFTSCNYRWQVGKNCLYFFYSFFFYSYHLSCISHILFVLYCKCFILWYYCFPENILLRTHLHRTSDLPICAFLLDCQSSEVSLFYFILVKLLFLFVCLFQTLGICLIWYRDAMWHSYYFCTEVRSIHLFCSAKNRHVEKVKTTSNLRWQNWKEYWIHVW